MDSITDAIDYTNCIAVVDADTILYQAALALQEDYITITHVDTEWTKDFKNVSAFRGRKKTHDGGWIGEQNAKRSDDKQISASSFTIEEKSKVVKEDFVAFGKINFKIKDIIKATGCKAVKLLIGGDDNFRYELAQATPYKEDRAAKPLRYTEVRKWMEKKFTSFSPVENPTEKDISVPVALEVADGEEADDLCAQYGHEDYKHFIKTKEHKYVLCYIDKDLKMIVAPRYSYNPAKDIVNTVHETTVQDAAYAFCIQLLIGDATDCINGLPNLTPEIQEKYELRKTRGVGLGSAEAILKDCNTVKCLFERVVECYKAYYGEEPKEFTSFRGEKSQRTWIDYMHENANLLYMRRVHGKEWDTPKMLERMGIEINEEKVYNDSDYVVEKTHGGQKARYGDSFYEYTIESENNEEDVLSYCTDIVYNCELTYEEYIKDERVGVNLPKIPPQNI